MHTYTHALHTCYCRPFVWLRDYSLLSWLGPSRRSPGSQHWMLRARLRTHYVAEQLVHSNACCNRCVSYNSKLCQSSHGMPIYNFLCNVLPHHLHSFFSFFSSIISSPFISTPHPPPSSDPARVNSIPATSRINKLSHLGAVPFLHHSQIRRQKRPEFLTL